MTRWTFYDANTSTTDEFEINPNAGGSPRKVKNVLSTPTTAPGGNTLRYEGNSPPDTLTWSGVILSQTQYDTYVTWYTKKHQILLTDDLGRQMWIYISEFAPKRERAYKHQPVRYQYDVSAVILDWPSPWDLFIQTSSPWFWWRLGEQVSAVDGLVARDRMGRVDANYRMAGEDGVFPSLGELADLDYGFSGPADTDNFPYAVTGQSSLVVGNVNKATQFIDTASWVETPAEEFGTLGFDAYLVGEYPWFTQWTVLCLFQIQEYVEGDVLDFFLFRHPGADDVWRVGVFADSPFNGTDVTLFGVSINGSDQQGSAGVSLDDTHLLVVSQEVTLDGGFDPDLINWRGDWDADELYAVNDVVSTIYTDGSNYSSAAGGNHYVATAANSNTDPDSSGDPPWAVLSVNTSTIRVYLDNVEEFTFSGLASPGIAGVFRMFTSLDGGNGVPMTGVQVVGDEVVVWPRVLSSAERATALETSGI